MLTIGTLMNDVNGFTDQRATIESDSSRRILICGKTGTGKSYTLGVLIEELERNEDVITIIIDPQGIFWGMAQPNREQEDAVWDWGESPQGLPITVLVPGDPVERYGGEDVVEELENRGVHLQTLKLNPSDISPEMWCELFDLDISELIGSTLFKAVRDCKKKLGRDFFIPDIINEVERGRRMVDKTKEAVIRRLEMAMDWEIFEEVRYLELWEILNHHGVNILDLSPLDPGRHGLRNLVTAVLMRFIFRQRSIAKRKELLNLAQEMPRVWLAIDEAHNFCPSGSSSLAKEILIRWAKEGRQPGLSLIVASQRPSAIDQEVLTQCDIKLVHRITSKDDRRAINALSDDYLDERLDGSLKQIRNVGEAVLIDDTKETVEIVKIRPRWSFHGGN